MLALSRSALMHLRRITFHDKPRWYLFFGSASLPADLQPEKPATVQELDTLCRSRFFLHQPTGSLLMVKLDKYSPRRHFLRWLGRMVIYERLLLQVDAHKEYRGNRIYRRAGLSPVPALAWGVALNPFNPMGSVFIMDYLSDAVSGWTWFDQSDDSARRALLDKVCDGLARLANLGYYNRDAHLGNLMVRRGGEILWIDTHLSRLPRNSAKRKKTLIESVTRKIRMAPWQDYVRNALGRLV